MLAKITSCATVGLSCVPIDVEVDIAAGGLPAFSIVGLPDKAVEEAKERVRSAIKNSGGDFPPRRITVNLAPADLPKEGPSYDFPIALGILVASGQVPAELLRDALLIGELSLDGTLRHTNGILSIAMFAAKRKIKRIFIPEINSREASVVAGVHILPVSSLLLMMRFLLGDGEIKPSSHKRFKNLLSSSSAEFDFSEIGGQEHVKRSLEVAAAGSHNIFMKGVPGSGKTMLARAFPGILPRLAVQEALEVTSIYSVTGNLPPGESLVHSRPFRSPHHTTSRVGLVGGGSNPKPGEISLSHRGVLFLDEFPEFPRHVLEALRQPMEDGVVTISRALGSVSFPAKFQLIAASNPCPCGYFGDSDKQCRCLPGQISRYQKRVSGPIIDRIDIHVDVPKVRVEKLEDLQKRSSAETSKVIRERVQKARTRQLTRLRKTRFLSNSEMTTKAVREFCGLSDDCQKLLTAAARQLNLSARSYYKVIKIARTVADLAGEQEITPSSLAEALQYRPRAEEML